MHNPSGEGIEFNKDIGGKRNQALIFVLPNLDVQSLPLTVPVSIGRSLIIKGSFGLREASHSILLTKYPLIRNASGRIRVISQPMTTGFDAIDHFIKNNGKFPAGMRFG